MEKQLLIDAISTSAREVFSTMLGLEIHVADALAEDSLAQSGHNLVALIGMAGDWIGTGVISCSPQFACQIASLMLMTECDSVNEDVLDVVAEVANMIFGNVKNELEPHLGALCLSIPTVVFGKNFLTRTVGQQDWTILPVKAAGSDVELKFSLSPNRNARSGSRFNLRAQPLAFQGS